MEIKEVFGGRKEDVEMGEYNIFIGISLGNKWFTRENLRKYLRWALDSTKDRILFLIADKIHAINYRVRNRVSVENSLRKALEMGGKIEEMLKGLIDELPEEERGKVDILRWSEYEEKDLFWKKFAPAVREEFEKNLEFREEILGIVKSSIVDREFSEKKYLRFCDYILEEFIALYSGVYFNHIHYNVLPYPIETRLDSLIEDIRNGKKFLELGTKLPEKKCVEVILDE